MRRNFEKKKNFRACQTDTKSQFELWRRPSLYNIHSFFRQLSDNYSSCSHTYLHVLDIHNENVGRLFSLQGSVNILLTTMAAIDFLVLLCSLLFIGLPAITTNLISLHGETGRVAEVAKTTKDWLDYMVRKRTPMVKIFLLKVFCMEQSNVY